jgi:hypothetical protein
MKISIIIMNAVLNEFDLPWNNYCLRLMSKNAKIEDKVLPYHKTQSGAGYDYVNPR